MKKALIFLFTSCLVTFGFSIASCKQIDREPPLPDLHVWLLPSCPSAYESSRGLVDLAEGLAIDGLRYSIDKAAGWILDLAKDDRDGKAISSTAIGYLWWGDKKKSPRVASCAVFVLSDSEPATWCDRPNGPFSARDSAVCEYFRTHKDTAVGSLVSRPPWQGNSLPRFYAEVSLEASPDKTAVTPNGALYYYPAGLHGGQFRNKDLKRTVVISVHATVPPDGKVALSTVFLMLNNIAPADQLVGLQKLEESSISPWSSVLSLQEPRSVKGEDVMMPVNVSGSVREVGAPIAALQLAGKVLESGKVAAK
jgi:hypothetical protein